MGERALILNALRPCASMNSLLHHHQSGYEPWLAVVTHSSRAFDDQWEVVDADDANDEFNRSDEEAWEDLLDSIVTVFVVVSDDETSAETIEIPLLADAIMGSVKEAAFSVAQS